MEMTIRFPGGSRVDAGFGGFTVQTDQSPDHGGAGSAPEPYDLFAASLGTCAGTYALSFCRERDLPTAGLAIELKAAKDPKSGLFTRFDLEIQLPDGFPDRYRKAICRVAGMCTVKRSLANPPAFSITAS